MLACWRRLARIWRSVRLRSSQKSVAERARCLRRSPIGRRSDAQWRLVDKDRALLEIAAEALPEARVRHLDLATDVEQAVARADAVVASALFDLVSAPWIDRLIRAMPAEACLYAALTYDGVERWAPSHADDASVLKAFGVHMQSDKGFGVALGPRAVKVLADKLRADDRPVMIAPSPWRLDAETDQQLMSELADGIALAASEMGAFARSWRKAPRERAEIGHLDLFAGPRRISEDEEQSA